MQRALRFARSTERTTSNLQIQLDSSNTTCAPQCNVCVGREVICCR